MLFLNPTYLWALLGLIVPVAIHLWSKKKGKIIKVGSTKLFSETDSKKSKSIQFNEWLLLFLRMFIISLLVIIIAGPRVKKKVDTIPITYIIEPDLLKTERIRTIIDTLEKGSSLRLLQAGLPEFQENDLDRNNPKAPYYWQLAKEMEALQTDSIVVFTNAFITGIKGKRPQINKKITWITIPQENQTKKRLKATKKENGVASLFLSGTDQFVTFKKELFSSDSDHYQLNSAEDSVFFRLDGKQEKISVTAEKSITVLLKYQDSLSNQVTYIKASLSAISKYLDKSIEIQTLQDIAVIDTERFDMIVWLSKDSIPDTSAKVLVYKPDELASYSIEPGPTKKVFYLTKALTSENIIDQHFSEQLLSVFDFHKDIEKEVEKYDKRTVALEELLPIYSNSKASIKNSAILDISNWLWCLLALLLVTERIIAKQRKQ